MGQAKRRGTLEERVALASERNRLAAKERDFYREEQRRLDQWLRSRLPETEQRRLHRQDLERAQFGLMFAGLLGSARISNRW